MQDDEGVTWTGSVDSSSQLPHGRGTLHLGAGVRFEGRVHHGTRCGTGTLYVDEGCGESALRVHWRDDVPNGQGSFLDPDGRKLVGTWTDGELNGWAHEEHTDGTLRFVGHFLGGMRHGDGIAVHEDGGCLVGNWVNGSLHGQRCAYLYPCNDEGVALVGEWRHGELHRAFATQMMDALGGDVA
jgi:hypothetical protein